MSPCLPFMSFGSATERSLEGAIAGFLSERSRSARFVGADCAGDVATAAVFSPNPRNSFTEFMNEKFAALAPAAVKIKSNEPIAVNNAIRLTTRRDDILFFDMR